MVTAKKKDCGEINNWIKSVINHFWWACATCLGDANLLQEKWIGLLYHVRGIHQWQVGGDMKTCEHDDFTELKQAETIWIEANSKMYEALEKIIMDKSLLKDLKYVSHFKHTGQLEVYHSLLNKYCPKRLSFSYPGMIARTQLATLDHNSGLGRKHDSTADGKLKYKIVHTKITNQWVAKNVLEPKNKLYLADLTKEFLLLCGGKSEAQAAHIPATPQNMAPTENSGKEAVVARMVSRFK